MPTFMGEVDQHRILLNVFVGPPETPKEVVRALIDTGATISCVTPTLVERLSLGSAEEWERLEGVHGPKDVPIYQAFLGIPISDHRDDPAFVRADPSIRVAEVDFSESAGFEALLGMDFLHPFHLTLFRNHFILSN